MHKSAFAEKKLRRERVRSGEVGARLKLEPARSQPDDCFDFFSSGGEEMQSKSIKWAINYYFMLLHRKLIYCFRELFVLIGCFGTFRYLIDSRRVTHRLKLSDWNRIRCGERMIQFNLERSIGDQWSVRISSRNIITFLFSRFIVVALLFCGSNLSAVRNKNWQFVCYIKLWAWANRNMCWVKVRRVSMTS